MCFATGTESSDALARVRSSESPKKSPASPSPLCICRTTSLLAVSDSEAPSFGVWMSSAVFSLCP